MGLENGGLAHQNGDKESGKVSSGHLLRQKHL